MTLSLILNIDQHITAEIHDIGGEKIKTLVDGVLPGGYYEVYWNGDTESGIRVKDGVYFYKIRTGNGTELTDKIILIK